jgi:hypothetical protein
MPENSETAVSNESPIEMVDGVFTWIPEKSMQMQKVTLLVGAGAAVFTGYSLFRADHFADLANAEMNSQSDFESFSERSNTWKTTMLWGSLGIANVASFYLGSQIVKQVALEEVTTLSSEAADQQEGVQ